MKKKLQIIITFFILCLFLFSIFSISTGKNIIMKNNQSIENKIIKTAIGSPKGINPGRVVWIWNPNLTINYFSGFWWEQGNINQTVVNDMFSKGIRNLTDSNSDEESWDLLFRHFNKEYGKGDIGYQTGERISIKANLANNKWGTYEHYDNDIDTNPYLFITLLRQLTEKAGVPEENITVFDVSKPMHHWFYDIVSEAFPNVYYADLYGEAEGRNKVIKSDTSVYFAWGNCKNRTLPECVVDADYLINIPLLKRHPTGNGITLSGKNLFGCLADDVHPLHPYLIWGSIMGNPSPQVDLLGHKDLGKKTFLYIGDATFATRDTIKDISRFNMYPFDNDWTNSLFFSQDPIALDSVMHDFLKVEGTHPSKGSHNYLHQAADPPSNLYDPENDGVYLSDSLGVHEHCDSNVDIFSKERYSGPENNGIDYIAIGKDHAKLSVDIIKPMRREFYCFGNSIMPLRNINSTIVIGIIKVKALINGNKEPIDKVEFYLNGNLKNTDFNEPYEWLWLELNIKKYLKLEVKAYSGSINSSEEIFLWKF